MLTEHSDPEPRAQGCHREDATQLGDGHFVQGTRCFTTQRNVSAKAFGIQGLILKAFKYESVWVSSHAVCEFQIEMDTRFPYTSSALLCNNPHPLGGSHLGSFRKKMGNVNYQHTSHSVATSLTHYTKPSENSGISPLPPLLSAPLPHPCFSPFFLLCCPARPCS